MKRFVQASLMAALAISSIAASTTAIPTAATAAVASTALPRWYREIVFYGQEYSSGASPFPGPGPTPGGTETRVMVGWIRYYCDGTVRMYGRESGDYEDYFIHDCT